MFYTKENKRQLASLEKQVSIEGHVKDMRLRHKLRKQDFRKEMKRVFGPVTKTNEATGRALKVKRRNCGNNA